MQGSRAPVKAGAGAMPTAEVTASLDRQIASLEQQKQQVVKQLDDAIGRLKEQRDRLSRVSGG